jgi:hypothetical protein
MIPDTHATVKTFLCGTTGRTFMPTPLRIIGYAIESAVFVVWASCPYCDVFGYTEADPYYDPAQPQPHPLILDTRTEETRHGE